MSLNGLNQRILYSQRDIILHNEKEIAQLKVQNEGLSDGLSEGLKAKKRWQKATLIIGSVYVLTILALAQL